MTTREAGRAGKTVATATLIEAVRADGIEWEDHRGRVVMLAEDHDALRAACAAVLDEVIVSGHVEMCAVNRTFDDPCDCGYDNARALREKL